MTKASEYRDQSVEDLEATLSDLRKQHFALRNEFRQTRKAQQPHRLPNTRKEIARILTVLSEKRAQSTGAA